jgi:mannose-6-phosphate isomerase-like protein (cupin superfamily)
MHRNDIVFISVITKSISFDSDNSNLKRIDFRSDGTICLVTRDGKMLTFNKKDKPHFITDTGEDVIELSGMATDKNEDKSLAIVSISVDGYSIRHYHSKRTEKYYIISGTANNVIDDKPYQLKAGDVVTIHPMQRHQIFNTSKTQKLKFLVESTPAWVKEDQLTDEMQNTNENTNGCSNNI